MLLIYGVALFVGAGDFGGWNKRALLPAVYGSGDGASDEGGEMTMLGGGGMCVCVSRPGVSCSELEEGVAITAECHISRSHALTDGE